MGWSLGRADVDLPVEVVGEDSHQLLFQRDPRSQTWGSDEAIRAGVWVQATRQNTQRVSLLFLTVAFEPTVISVNTHTYTHTHMHIKILKVI